MRIVLTQSGRDSRLTLDADFPGREQLAQPFTMISLELDLLSLERPACRKDALELLEEVAQGAGRPARTVGEETTITGRPAVVSG